MIPNPILKVLFTFKRHKVKCLLIGGQACIIYGAAEFSRDSDFVILCDHKNLKNLEKALASLGAELIYVPSLEKKYLDRGHACHFRCYAKDVENLRIDVLSKIRGCDSFKKLWKRKYKVILKNGEEVDVIGLSDLVQSKKTQRDKDWLMLKRLVENDLILNKHNPTVKKIKWWLLECRDPHLLIELVHEFPEIAKKLTLKRPLLSLALASNPKKLLSELHKEEALERNRDVIYWKPLRKELENLRHKMVGKEERITGSSPYRVGK